MGDTSEMSFWDHLDVLRGVLLRSAAAIVVLTAIFLCFKDALFSAVLWPASEDFVLYRLLGVRFSMDLINIEVSAQFFAHLRMAALSGVVLAFPYIIFELWKFIAPALYEKEKKAVGTAFAMSSGLFYLGVAVGYFVVLPVCLMFFMNYTVSPDIVNTITLGSYISIFTSMAFLIGIVFEFPAVAMVLSKLGVIDRGVLRKYRRHAFIAILVLSALITPSDPFSMVVLAIPMYGLYEFSIILCKRESNE